MAKVILTNTRRQPFLAVEYHDVVCRRRGKCHCNIRYGVSPNGKRVSHKDPSSFQVDALGSLRVDAAVLHLPQVKAALKSGWLTKPEIPQAGVVVQAVTITQPVAPKRSRR